MKKIVACIGLALLMMFASSGCVFVFTGTFQFTCTTFSMLGTVTASADRDNTGNGEEQVRLQVTDGAGTVLYLETQIYVVGDSISDSVYSASYTYTIAPASNPLTFTITSVAGNGFDEQIAYSVQGSCDDLTSPGTACDLAIPSGSVVGNAPLGAQIYWAPGQASSGVILNPGNYIVIGVDESGVYYKIVLACQTRWVRVDTMQPSYEAPQNGAPLPTRVVS